MIIALIIITALSVLALITALIMIFIDRFIDSNIVWEKYIKSLGAGMLLLGFSLFIASVLGATLYNTEKFDTNITEYVVTKKDPYTVADDKVKITTDYGEFEVKVENISVGDRNLVTGVEKYPDGYVKPVTQTEYNNGFYKVYMTKESLESLGVRF